ncbi:MAG: endonuclease/exonuclease/phosphatase family protein [Myxococcales bacterium]|nr:endonuclease/exonuclease/phosphatase family protein [Myxococcales bacterium]
MGTWNVHLFFDDVCDSGHCGGSNFEYAPTTAEFEGRAQQIALAIERLEVDVIMLEEVENQRALDAIVSYLPDDWVTEVLGETGFDASIDVAVLARIPLSEVRTHRSETPLVLPNGDTTTFARELLEVRLQNGMIVFAAHFRSKVNDEPERRLAEARAARAIVLDVAAEEPGATVVLGGDLNDVPDSPPLDALTSGDDGLVRLAAELFPGADWTIRFESEHLAIDHLLVPHGASLAAFVPRTVGVARENSNGGYGGSDHGAVRAIFRPDPAVTFPPRTAP